MVASVCVVRGVVTGLAVLALTVGAFAQPANDACGSASASPIPAGGGTVTGSVIGAAADGTSGCTGTTGPDAFHAFTPNAPGPWRLSLCNGTSSSSDSVMSIHTGCPADATNQVAGGCDDDGCSFFGPSQIGSVTLTPGTTYVVRVAAYDEVTDTFDYTLTVVNLAVPGACCAPGGACTVVLPSACTSPSSAPGGAACMPSPCAAPPANDECAGAPSVTVGTPVMGTNVAASESVSLTNDGSNPYCTQATWGVGGAGTQSDVFWKFTAPATADYEITTCGSSIDTILSVHSGCPVTQGNLVSCNDDAGSGAGNAECTGSGNANASRIPHVTLTAGTDYYIRVFGYDGETGPIVLSVNFVDATGTCCVDTTCTLTDAANCSGTFASGATCGAGACGGATGVCCRGSTCNTTVAQSNCVVASGSAGSRFVASAGACNATAISNTPCCYADYNKVNGLNAQDIFDFLNDWFALSPYARTGSDGSPALLSAQNIFDFLNAWFAGGC